MRHSSCWRNTNANQTQSEKGDSNVDENEVLQVRILRRRCLQVWLPRREYRGSNQRLRVRGSMQLLPHLQLQNQLGAAIGAAHFD